MTDEELVLAVRRGEAEAFGLLSARMQAVLRARANAALAHNSALGLDDLLQEGMLGFLSAIGSFRPDAGAGFRTYASVCIANRLTSYLRRRTVAAEALDESDLPADMYARDPQDIFEARDDGERVRAAICGLTALEREALERFLDGESYEAIAAAMHTSTKAIDNALQRVRRKIKKVL